MTKDLSYREALLEAQSLLEQCLVLLDTYGDSLAAAHIDAALQEIAREQA